MTSRSRNERMQDTTSQFHLAMQEAKKNLKFEKKEINKIGKKQIVKERLAQLYITGEYTNKEIADLLGVTLASVNWFLAHDDELREKILSYQERERELVNSKLHSMRTKALDSLTELLDSEDNTVRLNAVKDVLDRTGHKAKEQKEVNINVSYEERLAELSSGVDTTYIDASYIDVTCDEPNLLEGSKKGE